MRFEDLEFNTPPQGRQGFTFGYDSAKLAEACQKEATYHREREAHYEEEAARLEGEVREKGLTLKEQQVTGGAQFLAQVDPGLASQLSEARTRRDRHRIDAELFEAYTGAFKATTGTYWLTIDDVRYFGIYHVAMARGTDVDQPRNLAKSVTVEYIER